ncbi:MAG: zinc ribbon domain-containing protein [bacterium]
MRCPHCGHENAHGKIVCARCGTRLRAGAAAGGPQHDPEQFMKYLRADLFRIAIVTIVVVAAAVLLGLSVP